MSKENDPPYKVGKGRPPLHTRFPKGRSANPGGRKRGVRNFNTILRELMESEIEITESGKKRKSHLVDAILLRQAQEALRGDQRAIENLLNRYERWLKVELADEARELAEEDEALLERHLRAGQPADTPGGDEAEDAQIGSLDPDGDVDE